MSQPEMRYISVDLLTRTVIEDLPLYGTSFNRRISGAGNMTGSYKLGTGLFSDNDLLSASEAGLRALFALRNNKCIWAGPIWSRTYQSQANVISLTGQTFESIFSKIKMGSTVKATGADQIAIFKTLIDTMQLQQSCGFGIDTSLLTNSGVLQDLVVFDYEQRLMSDIIDDMLKASNSFDYIIDYDFDTTTNVVTIWVKTGYPFLGYNQPGIDLDYPGSVSNYYYPESAAGDALVRQTVLGKGEGTSMPVAIYTNNDRIVAGYPMWEGIRSEKSIDNLSFLSRIAEEAGRTHSMPVTVPTIELVVDEAIDFAEWGNFGVPINLHIEDVRFPDGKEVRQRMIGWDYTPPSSESIEQLKVILEGQDS